ncbi:DoxX family protein [Polymorphobacter fuscus]|uniref:DoxX family membrane protein n=1 Tax=Sandarakinorhabdus fusca TaxID=1439888 RepID=A0A7C9KH07_9SPHN|nr:DoxX family protein [Polymorphobacter fuscus]KAB7648555.1 DoxX family protein [Polymorphobacter fuscus]MQT16101.1 DoxX family membrane protein [Polymorphobacter fuscus]NJC07620.1 putative membrane protein YphA (DoxX/SURF4 family) [Polymorphobacter fuscus]
MTPRLVAALLDWPPAWFLARLLLVSAYLFGAVVKLGDWPAAVAEQLRFGLHPPMVWAAVTIAVDLVGSLLVLSSRLVWLGAGMLGVLTLVAGIVVGGFGLVALLARRRDAGP